MVKKKNNTQSLVVIVLLILMGLVAIIAIPRLTNRQALNTPSRADEVVEGEYQGVLPSCVEKLFKSNGRAWCEDYYITCTDKPAKLSIEQDIKCRVLPPDLDNRLLCESGQNNICEYRSKEWWAEKAAEICGCENEEQGRNTPSVTPTWSPRPTIVACGGEGDRCENDSNCCSGFSCVDVGFDKYCQSN